MEGAENGVGNRLILAREDDETHYTVLVLKVVG